ncbi:unnamed protein product [Clonostachys byssicola]|uniref:F-box domain-containing protein n=1 Tax=Clonostachys byssicola TaxID=160290 RepID=A0A9N9US88_9HYPO|nr:unnamed protein product [Clonostachys byssicola]
MSPTAPSTSVQDLPNEILSLTLTNFLTKELIPIACTSRRFHSIVAETIRRRLLEATTLPGHELVFECYHPSARLTTPSLACHFLGVKDLPQSTDEPRPSPLSLLDRQQYASLRPTITEEERRTRRRRRSRRNASSTDEEEDDSVTEDIYLDEDEHFTQLCTKVHVSRLSPRQGYFLTHVNVFDGVIRLWRDSLAELSSPPAATEADEHGQRGTLIWADTKRTVGVRLEVTPGGMERMPVLSGPDDLPPMSYKILYLELLVPVSELLLAVEKSAIQEDSQTGKAIVIAFMN